MKIGLQIPEDGANIEQLIGTCGWLASMGIETVIGSVVNVWKLAPLEIIGDRLIPAVAGLAPARV